MLRPPRKPTPASRKWLKTHLANRRKRKAETAVAYKGDNFRFVLWGGLADVRLNREFPA
jgi:hypothetical protein